MDLLTSLPEFKSADNVGIYLSGLKEACTDRIVALLFQERKSCFVPWWNSDYMELIKMDSIMEIRNLENNKMNIPMPSFILGREKAFNETILDVLVIPCLAFNHNGNRLGHGKGFVLCNLKVL